jgi:hypothetical protein
MAAAPDFHALTRRLRGRARRRRRANRIGECLQVVRLDRLLGRVADRQPNNIPAAWRSHPVGMPGAEVITVRFHECGEGAENRCGVPIDVGQRVHRDLPAGWSGALASCHVATAQPRCWHPAASSIPAPTRPGLWRSLTTADGIDRQTVTPPPGAHCAIVSPAARSQRRGLAPEAGIRSVTVHDGDGIGRAKAGRVRRRDRHGRGLRGPLVPPGVPFYRTRSERFDDLVLLAVSQLEPRWEAELSGIEFGVEEIPPVIPDNDDPEPIPLARLEPGAIAPGERPAGHLAADPSGLTDLAGLTNLAEPLDRPARIVLYRRPLLARADGQEELAELVLDVIVEQFARWLGVDPQTVDPGYPAED